MSRPPRVAARTTRGAAVPDDAADDTVLDERTRCFGVALEVERLRQAARVERVVDSDTFSSKHRSPILPEKYLRSSSSPSPPSES